MYSGINKLKYHLARILGHGVGCRQSCPDEITIEMVVVLESIKEASSKRARRKDEMVGVGRSSSQSEAQFQTPCTGNFSSTVMANKSITSSFFNPHTTPGSQPTLDNFNDKKRKEADMAVRRFWYHNSLSFNYAKSYFYQPMVDTIACVGPRYKAPTYNALRGKELDEELECVKEQLESIKSSRKFTSCTLMSNGWTDQRACPKGTMFLKSIDASANVKDAHLIFSLLADVVEDFGVANVVQVIMDNAANYVVAGRLLCAKYPTIFWTSCIAHYIDLMLEDTGKLEWV
eukprot:PITA_34061